MELVVSAQGSRIDRKDTSAASIFCLNGIFETLQQMADRWDLILEIEAETKPPSIPL
ncbi:hypothetical protein SAMN05444358_11271 [Ruegeria halocynthiae]|uniref:Uncharacterized protein n=1 Tax=Ruegeria halocynthiae TaxID=985054 RepID=A0A1H3EUY1_9RHOB|nr:hypothetical protein SAMN05444358_11271 [Ruegeria halocynthiae]